MRTVPPDSIEFVDEFVAGILVEPAVEHAKTPDMAENDLQKPFGRCVVDNVGTVVQLCTFVVVLVWHSDSTSAVGQMDGPAVDAPEWRPDGSSDVL